MSAFISEDDLKTFEGWMTFQAIDPTALSAEQLETWRELFEESRTRAEVAPKVGLMKLSVLQSGESRYAVAIKDGGDLWLTLWVRRSRKGEFFVMVPRGCKDWDPHTSYHLDGTLHVKSFGEKFGRRKKQPLGGVFQGVENLGGYAGHGSGAVCDRSSFTGVVEVAEGVLGPKHGAVFVHLCEPGRLPNPDDWPNRNVAVQQVFDDAVPHVVITVVVEP